MSWTLLTSPTLPASIFSAAERAYAGMVPKGKDGPATRVVFGDPKRSENKQAS